MTPSPAHGEAELARLRAENAVLRETLDAVDGGIVVFDGERRFRFGNRIYHEVFPHLPPDEHLVGRRYEEVLALSIAAGSVRDPQAATDPEAFIARRVREVTDRDAPQSEERHDAATGRWSLVRTRWTAGGNRVSLQVDITELKRLQQELLRAQRMEAIGRISGGVAHDFNNLLTVITSNLEVLSERLTDPAGLALAAGALAAAGSGSRLIGQLLTFSRRDMTRPRVLDVNLLITDMQELLRRAVGEQVGVGFELDTAAPPCSLDAAQFEAALLNLVLNARQAVAESGRPGRITIATRYEAGRHGAGAGGGVLAVTVTDTGCGMTAEVAAQAFEPFFTTREPGGGSGLGLAQVWGFAAGAGGSAAIDSAPGQGTTVVIRLPAATVAPADAPAQPLHAAHTGPGAGQTVLVVEDDEAVLACTGMILRNLGYQVLSASGAEEALSLLAQPGPVHLLFSDITMPGGISGIALAARAQACRPGIKVLLTSGYPAAETGPNAADLQGLDFIAKPYRRDELRERLAGLLDG